MDTQRLAWLASPTTRGPHPSVSVVVPVFNEERAIARFLAVLSQALNRQNGRYEIIFIDDGSSDNTWKVISEAASRDSKIAGIRLARNFGKEAALTAGLDVADGDVVVPIDVDLQDPP